MSELPHNDNADVATMFAELFSLETGIISSPVMAIAIGEKFSNDSQSKAFWQLAETEFYDSPFFSHAACLPFSEF